MKPLEQINIAPQIPIWPCLKMRGQPWVSEKSRFRSFKPTLSDTSRYDYGSSGMVEWEMICFPHVRDLWCGNGFKLPGNHAPLPTFSPASIPRGQCSIQTCCIDSSMMHPTPSRSRWIFSNFRSYRLSPYAAIRVGEADNPGPSHLSVKFGVTNPTTVYKKGYLANDLGVDVLMLSETAATNSVQLLESRSFRERGYHTVWGHPTLPHRQTDRDSGNDTFKGIAAGVSTHAKYPIRSTRLGDTSEWFEAGRFQQVFIQFPHHEFQILNIYGYPANDRKARLKTNQLIDHAITVAMTNTFPMILCGDFNHPPDDLEALHPLWERGFMTAAQLYHHFTGFPLPPTFQESTRNDVAIFSPTIVPMIKKIWIDDQKLVAGHNPLCFEMHLPDSDSFQQTWHMPKTWIPLDPNKPLIAKHYVAPNFQNDPNPLLTWSASVEAAVHQAIKEETAQQDLPGPTGLPKSHRGRCQTPCITKRPLPRGIKPAWHDHYTPDIDQPTIHIKQLTKQMRRIQSLKRRIQRWEIDYSLMDSYYHQLWEEWMCIVRAKGFPQGFLQWLQDCPELTQVPLHLPTSEYLYDVEQLLKHHVNHIVHCQNQKHLKISAHMRSQDVRKYGRAGAFKSVKEQSAGMLQRVQQTHTVQVTMTAPPAYGLLEIQLPDHLRLDTLEGLTLNNHPVQVTQHNHPRIELMLHEPDAHYADPLMLQYTKITMRPDQVASALDDYWRTFWDRDSDCPADQWTPLEALIDQVTPLPIIDMDLTDLQDWKQAIKAMKSKSARGCCAWAPDELKQLPDECIRTLSEAFQHLSTRGMGQDLMAAKTVPLMKKPDAYDASHTRPITVLSLLYRLWGRVVSQKILRTWGQHFPKAVTGFLPQRSTFLPMYETQHRLEQTHHAPDTMLSGLTLDITKCFNTLPLLPARKLMQVLGVPESVLSFWIESIQALHRVWQIGKQTFETGPQTTGVPEGDAMSVLVMLAYNFLWTNAMTRELSQDQVEPYPCILPR